MLPEYPDRDAARRMTIGQLLSHSAGLGMLFDRPGFDRRRDYAWHRELLPVFAGAPLAFEPGTRSEYRNEGYVVLAAVVEKLSGLSFREYLRRHVWGPAGMRDTDAFRLDEVVPSRAVGYAHMADDPLGTGERRPNWTFLACCGGAGPGTGIDAECNWFLDGRYTVVVLGNYDPMAATALSDGILGFLARQ